MRAHCGFFTLALTLLCAPIVFAKSTRFDMKDAVQRNTVYFVSDTLLEKIVGTTSAISGWVELDPERVADGIKGEFEVDARTLDTGIEVRNEHLREKFLSTGEFPYVTFSLHRVVSSSKPKLTDRDPTTLRVEGTLKIKGTARLQTISIRTTYFKESDVTRSRGSGNLLRLSATFDVDLPSYNVTWNDALKMKLAKAVQVSIDVIGTDTAPPPLVPTPLANEIKLKEKPSTN